METLVCIIFSLSIFLIYAFLSHRVIEKGKGMSTYFVAPRDMLQILTCHHQGRVSKGVLRIKKNGNKKKKNLYD